MTTFFIPTNIIGIVNNTLYIDGLYAGDHLHSFNISISEKKDFIERGVREFSSYYELLKAYEEVPFDDEPITD